MRLFFVRFDRVTLARGVVYLPDCGLSRRNSSHSSTWVPSGKWQIPTSLPSLSFWTTIFPPLLPQCTDAGFGNPIAPPADFAASLLLLHPITIADRQSVAAIIAYFIVIFIESRSSITVLYMPLRLPTRATRIPQAGFGSSMAARRWVAND